MTAPYPIPRPEDAPVALEPDVAPGSTTRGSARRLYAVPFLGSIAARRSMIVMATLVS